MLPGLTSSPVAPELLCRASWVTLRGSLACWCIACGLSMGNAIPCCGAVPPANPEASAAEEDAPAADMQRGEKPAVNDTAVVRQGGEPATTTAPEQLTLVGPNPEPTAPATINSELSGSGVLPVRQSPVRPTELTAADITGSGTVAARLREVLSERPTSLPLPSAAAYSWCAVQTARRPS
jgi:hypothetical protein